MKSSIKSVELLKNIIIFDGGLLKVPNDFIKDHDYVVKLLKDINELLIDLTKISDKGYVNDHNINLPILNWLLNEYNLVEPKLKSPSLVYSVQLNMLCYNLVLLWLFKIVLILDDWYSIEYINQEKTDLKADITTLHKAILRLIDPKYRLKISNKGLSVVLNSVVGYDSEYELESCVKMTNRLLSIQLAGSTGMVLKVPIVDNELVKRDIKIDKLSVVCYNSIDEIIFDIRGMLYKENDKFLTNLLTKLSVISNIESVLVGDYKLFLFPRSGVKTIIKYLSEYSSKDLIDDSDSLNHDNHEKSLYNLIELLNDICGDKEMSSKLSNSITKSSNKHSSRITYRSGNLRLSVTINKILYICMHESSADLSVLKDFNVFKENMDIVSRSFVTINKPLIIEGCSSKIHIRDTILIAPMGAKSLAGVGNIYGDGYRKIDIGNYRGSMRKLLEDNKELFEKYALQDSIITHKHACSMETLNFSVGKIGVPLTISGIGKSYVLKEWLKNDYKGYQPRDGLVLGNLASLTTPKGARSVGISNFIIPFVSSYRGGRNESFMYGIDHIKEKRSWIDYDLTSCYTTVMSILGQPDYNNAVHIHNETVKRMSTEDLILNYIVLDVEFKFKNTVKYPCIPTRVDDDIDIYPREGRSTITGSEYLVARSMGCFLHVKSGVMVPFIKYNKKDKVLSISTYNGPFMNIVKTLQRKRRDYPKKSFYNYMYKEIGNSIYGQIAMGISGKKSFDIKTKSHVSIQGGILANPILSSYITGFTRALIGECLNNIQQLNGKIVSVTTDGFITDINDLENKMLSLCKDNINCLKLYRDVRRFLTTFEEDSKSEINENALEIKNIEVLGIISCKTRAQLGFSDGGISALSGFQTRNLDKSFLIKEISSLFIDNNRVFEFIQTGLRSANDIYKHGGHVVQKHSDRSFSIEYDNRRRILDNSDSIYNNVILLDSLPWQRVTDYGKIRILKNAISKPVYNKHFVGSSSKSYKSYIETSVRGFIKACLSDINNRYGIPVGYFKGYKSIIDFVYGYKPARVVKLSLSSVSRLKNRNTISRTVPRTVENEMFISYIKETFSDFDDDRFFKELSIESTRLKKELRNKV